VPAPIAPTTWQEQVLRAQALLSRASVEVGLESQGNLDLVAFQLAQAIGPAVKFPDLQPQGFKFVRAKLLRFGSGPLSSRPLVQDRTERLILVSNPFKLGGIVHGRFVANRRKGAKPKLTRLLFRGS